MKHLELSDDFQHFKQLEHDYIGYQSLTDVPRVLNFQDELKDYSVGTIVFITITFHQNRLFCD